MNIYARPIRIRIGPHKVNLQRPSAVQTWAARDPVRNIDNTITYTISVDSRPFRAAIYATILALPLGRGIRFGLWRDPYKDPGEPRWKLSTACPGYRSGPATGWFWSVPEPDRVRVVAGVGGRQGRKRGRGRVDGFTFPARVLQAIAEPTEKPLGYRERRRIARKRRKECAALIRLIPYDESVWDHWAARSVVLGGVTSADISELLRRGFPLHAGLRGEALAAYQSIRQASWRRRSPDGCEHPSMFGTDSTYWSRHGTHCGACGALLRTDRGEVVP